MKWKLGKLLAAALLASATLMFSQDAAHDTGTAAKDTAHATKVAGKDTGKATGKAAKATGKGVAKSAKAVGKAVKGGDQKPAQPAQPNK
jgi:hypothetical protein